MHQSWQIGQAFARHAGQKISADVPGMITALKTAALALERRGIMSHWVAKIAKPEMLPTKKNRAQQHTTRAIRDSLTPAADNAQRSATKLTKESARPSKD